MKKKYLIPIVLTSFLFLVACGSQTKKSSESTSGNDTSTGTSINYATDTSAYSYYSSISVPEPIIINEPVITEAFSLTTSDGEYSQIDNVYLISKAGTYEAKGNLEEGQIIVSAGEDDVVELALKGVSISNSTDSPIKALSGDKIEISAKANTQNVIKDNRSLKAVENENLGEGAINAKIDMKLKGSGTLLVAASYNNGIHTSDDLTIKNLTLHVTAPNNAIKGNDSVTIESGNVYAYSTNGQGIKTKNSDVSSKGNQRGTIEIDGGTVYVDSVYDGLDASYDVLINEADASVPTIITVKTGTKATNYKSSSFDKEASAKGLKAANNITINGGVIVVSGSDDAVHANYGDTLENGATGQGNITMNGGQLQVASGDDGLHADNTLTVNNGQIIVTGAKEGLEANHIKINGGETHVYGSDDGVNASKKINQTPTVEVTGGLLDVAVSNGDTDGIDSNGNFSQTGGVVISRGSPGSNGSPMSTGLDCDGTASITGGTFIAFNGMEKSPTTGSGVLKAATNGAQSSGFGPGGGRPGGPGGRGATTYTFSAGNYLLTGGDFNLAFVNNYNYGSFIIYSSLLSSGTTYTLSCNNSTIISWSQASSDYTIQ